MKETKTCTRCKVEKPMTKEYFYTAPLHRQKTGFRSQCRDCYALYRQENREKIRKSNKATYDKNYASKYSARRKEYVKTEHAREVNRKWKEKNKDRLLEHKRKYMREYYGRRLKEEPELRLRFNVSRNVRFAIKRSQGSKRGKSTFDYLPYTPEELRQHLELQFDDNMNWENYGAYWDIDHIYPQSKLPYDSLEHPNFTKCWSLDNLQPLEKKENIRKGNKTIDGNKK